MGYVYIYIYTHWLVVWNMTGLWDIYIYIMCDIKAVAVYVIHCNTVYRYTYIYIYVSTAMVLAEMML